MARFTRRDINEIIEWFEDELDSLRNIDRIEKMKLRSKIRKQGSWLMAFRNPTSLVIIKKLEENLYDIFRLFRSDFKDNFEKLIKEKIKGIN